MADLVNVVVIAAVHPTKITRMNKSDKDGVAKTLEELLTLTELNFEAVDVTPTSSKAPAIALTVQSGEATAVTSIDRNIAAHLVHKLIGHRKLVKAVWIEEMPTLPTFWLSNIIEQNTCFARPTFNSAEPPPTTPNFSTRQVYLTDAPVGLNVQHAHAIPGGTGSDVRVVDVEFGWRFEHEELVAGNVGIIYGTNATDHMMREHGTSMLSILAARSNGIGVVGIAPDASVGACACPTHGQGHTSSAITAARESLRPGDILLLELQRANSRNHILPIEWWPLDFWAVAECIRRGIIVVSAAGNGGMSLDDLSLDVPDIGFPEGWRNPLHRKKIDSGSILVGAGTPAPGTHGLSSCGPGRARLPFSNYGEAVDAQGWGALVTSAGFGSLQGGTNPARFYMDESAGTSSAAPMVAGALACVQGALRRAGLAPLTPAQARTILRTTGSPQQDGLFGPRSQRIGSQPDLKQMISSAFRMYG